MMIKTAQEINKEIENIDAFLEHLYKTSQGGVERIQHSFPELLKDLSDKNISLKDPGLVKDYLLALRLKLKNIERVQISLPFSPSTEFVNKVMSWFRQAFDSNNSVQIILDIDVKPGLLAGMTINYRGKYRDYSAKTSIEKYFGSYRSINELLS